ncbi:TonB-dependent receptor [Larkinella humicola]|uniref:TonB-dependent receptor n=1 Tax=Larkinella humicola TaxID=2607654 RepID=A0A5N1JDF0_9BACT|nr:TonB-dependent receptor [Larkinella humicola]KAA9349824.1 TonB-dependent receptor [Larkinella humicola]
MNRSFFLKGLTILCFIGMADRASAAFDPSVRFLTNLCAQQNFTISGSVKDAQSGELMIGATIRVKERPGTGTVSNEYGFYSLTLPQGHYQLQISLLGFADEVVAVDLTSSQKLDLVLTESSQMLEEVVVKTTTANENITNPTMGIERLAVRDIRNIPVLMGERDPLKVLQLLPGIKSAGEGSSGFNVRGGNSDQNLILLDEAPVYNASHLLGFFSTFNADAIKDLALYKGGMPAQYGGRLSSVLDVKMNDGNNQDFHASGGIGLISSRLALEGPIQKGKSSFLLTGRRTYADAFLKLSNDPDLNKNTLYFYDLNAKLNYTISPKDRVYLSGYFGRDQFGLGDLFAINWGNATGTLRWNHLYNAKLFGNTSLIYSQYDYEVGVNNGSNQFNLKSSIQDINLKQEFSYFPNPKNSMRFGVNIIHHTITPRTRTATGENSSINNTRDPARTSFESALFFTNKWQPADPFTIEYGLRLTAFSVMGGNHYYTLDANKTIVDTLLYGRGEVVKQYLNAEPRVSMAYAIRPDLSVKASYTRNVQNLHLLSNANASTPNDRWVQSSNVIRPELADQVALGVVRKLNDNAYEFSTEVYYKTMQNQIDYRNGADFTYSDNLETQLLFGKGRAYGAEWLFRKKTGALSGWIGYTLSRTEKQIEGINNGSWYAAKQDRTHDISIVGIYKLSPTWTLSGTWVYNTGNAVSFPTGKYRIDGAVFFNYTERNGYRMPAYHRLDLGATVNFKKRRHFESDLAFGLYNAYGQANPYAINFEQSPDDPAITQVQRVTLFQFVPYITYNFKF